MGKSQKRKGAEGEREWASILRKHGYTDAHRGRQYHGGSGSPDVVGIPGVHFEVKRVERLELSSAIKQAENDSADNELPVVVHRKSNDKWYATLEAEELVELIKMCQLACYEGCTIKTDALNEWVGRYAEDFDTESDREAE